MSPLINIICIYSIILIFNDDCVNGRKFPFREIFDEIPKPMIKHSKYASRTIDLNGRINYGINIDSGNALSAPSAYAFNVLDAGAKGDGITDNTKAFNETLQFALQQGGGYVYAPTGKYLFNGQINIPDGVSLVGSYLTVPQHQRPTIDTLNDGTILLCKYGRKSNNISDSFITIGHSATLQGVTIFYPQQLCDGSVPVEYPPTIWMNQANSAVFDVELLNSWYGIYAVGAARHFISRVQGQPIYVGLFIDETYDIGRIENVHWNPWYCGNVNYTSIQTIDGTAFVFARSDWEYVLNTFSFGYAIGYHFIESSTGAMNGNFVGIGADYCCNVSILIDASQPMGLLITNAEFTAFHTDKFAPNNDAIPTHVIIGENNVGAVQFENTNFWGPAQYVARLYGDSPTTFMSCVFVQWDLYSPNGSPAIYSNNGEVILIGNTFMQTNSNQAIFDNGTKKVVMQGNLIEGDISIKVDKTVKNSISGNI